MPGKPLKRKRTETKLLRGETTQRELNGNKDDDDMEVIVINRTVRQKPVEPEPVESTENVEEPKIAESAKDQEPDPDFDPEAIKHHPGKNAHGRGGNAEYMRAMTRHRMEMAKRNPAFKGGRPKTKFTRAELEAKAIDRMTPKALKLLETQLNDEKLTPRERREVAKLVLEYKLGKPKQQIEQKIDTRISAIRFETAAFAGIPSADLTLPAGDVSDDVD